MEKLDMSGDAGVWLDHKKAVVVDLSGGATTTHVIVSQVEKHPARGGDSPLQGKYEARQVPADDKRQRALTGELNDYYDAVAAALRDHERLLLFGPGEAKLELQERLVRMKLGGHIVSLATEDKMTDPQIVAKVRAYFGAAPPRVAT
jgi:hypothetical protein